MITILMRKHIRYDELGRDVCLFGLAVASASELPSKYGIDGAVIHEASTAWDVSVGKKYGFLDNGGWREQATVINPMTLKGRVNSIEDLPSNAVPGWVYFVGSAGSENLPEYMYTEEHVWDPIGSNSITIEVDSALSTTSENPVQNKVITTALNGKATAATTLSGYGIADAKITPSTGTIQLGSNTLVPVTTIQIIVLHRLIQMVLSTYPHILQRFLHLIQRILIIHPVLFLSAVKQLHLLSLPKQICQSLQL